VFIGLPKKLDEEVARLHLEKIGGKADQAHQETGPTTRRAGGRPLQAGALRVLINVAQASRLRLCSRDGSALLSRRTGKPFDLFIFPQLDSEGNDMMSVGFTPIEKFRPVM